MEALASLIKTQKLTGSKNEFYVPLCDALLDLVELDITGVRALKLSQIAHSLAHDFLNLAMLCALNRPHELKTHVRGALTNGATREEIREVFMQVAIYCGVPAGVDAFRNAREVFAELDGQK